MKTTLSQKLVLDLTFEQKPTAIKNGKINSSEPNANSSAYIVFDDHRDAPVGFGVKVGKTGKSYIIQRKLSGKVIKSKVGNVRDFSTIDQARQKAREFVQIVVDTGRNPNAIAAEKSAAEITLGEAFDDYESHLETRAQPASANTFKVLERARKHLQEWMSRRVRDLTSREIIAKFDEMAKTARTSAEQTFRWANVAVAKACAFEAHGAQSQGREPTLTHNPFGILRLQSKFRTRSQLEMAYIRNGVRNPMANDSIGPWLKALWDRRRHNRTGCDYLLCSLLWGTRKSEAASLQWFDRISTDEAAKNSFVDLDKRLVVFKNTKNHVDHELPISDAILELLKQRHELTADMLGKRRLFVFPAESRFSKTGHYSDPRSLLKYIQDDAGINRLTHHDLRRSFGRVVDGLGLPYKTTQRLLNHGALSDPTTRYAQPEWLRLCEYMQRIEDAFLSSSPKVYNALRPLRKAPMSDGKEVL